MVAQPEPKAAARQAAINPLDDMEPPLPDVGLATRIGDLGPGPNAGQGDGEEIRAAPRWGISPLRALACPVGVLSTLVLFSGCKAGHGGAWLATLFPFAPAEVRSMLRRSLAICALAASLPLASRALDCPSPERKGQTPGGYTICK